MRAAFRAAIVAASLLALAHAAPRAPRSSTAGVSRTSEPRKLQMPGTPAGILVFTRFNCAFPFCPTTALDVCAIDEHFESGHAAVLATLIEQTETAAMNFLAYSDFDNSTRLHYTLAARPGMMQVFTVHIAPNGTAGALLHSVPVQFPDSVFGLNITYFFTAQSNVYVAFENGALVSFAPKTGALLQVVNILPTQWQDVMLDSSGSVFDPKTQTFYVNGQGNGGFYLHSYNVKTSTVNVLGPLPPAAGTAGPNNTRVDNTLASVGPAFNCISHCFTLQLSWLDALSLCSCCYWVQLVVYPPASVGGGMKLMEMRNSPDDPFLFMAWLDPVTGASTLVDMPDWGDWYLNYELDPMIYLTQWAGSSRRVWSYDPINNCAWFKLYDECGGNGDDDCAENEAILALPWVPPAYVDWDVAVEPVEPQLTQMIWVWTDVVN